MAVLCQFTDEIDYTTCFKALQERNCYDAMDTYYSCIWDISILEYLVRILTQSAIYLNKEMIFWWFMQIMKVVTVQKKYI